MLDYRSEIGLLSGWMHHTVYVLILSWVVRSGCTAGFMVFSPAELPTFILALGSVHKPWRLDLPMGLTFFATRIVYFTYAFCTVQVRQCPLNSL
jgi:hypothetical protein